MRFPLRSRTRAENGLPGGKRRARYRAGLRAERLAAVYLRLRGYRILARRFKCPVGEVDLIAKRFGHVAFVEVKRRASLEAAAHAVTGWQQQRIGRAASLWLAQNEAVRFSSLSLDVMLIAPGRWPRHIRSAFEAG